MCSDITIERLTDALGRHVPIYSTNLLLTKPRCRRRCLSFNSR